MILRDIFNWKGRDHALTRRLNEIEIQEEAPILIISLTSMKCA